MKCIDAWGLKHYRLWVKSDGEPAIKAFARAVREQRQAGSLLVNSPARDPHGNGVAERAIKEYASVLRRLKLGLEWRIGGPVDSRHPVFDWVTQHASFIINHFLVGSQDGFTPFRRTHRREYKGQVIEFGEMIWAKPRVLPRTGGGRRPVGLEPRAVPAIWVGIYEPTGENLVIAIDGHKPAFRVRTVARRPPSGESPSMMSPPCERAMSRAIARPKPVPPLS